MFASHYTYIQICFQNREIEVFHRKKVSGPNFRFCRYRIIRMMFITVSSRKVKFESAEFGIGGTEGQFILDAERDRLNFDVRKAYK